MTKATDPCISISELNSIFGMRNGVVTRIKSKRKQYIGSTGNKRSDGYLQFNINGKLVLAHRISFALANRRWPTSEIDHIDGNRSNNDPANLREVTRNVNRHNSRLAKNNTTGFKGVSIRPESGRYSARIRYNHVCKRLGDFSTPEEASQAYEKAALELYGE